MNIATARHGIRDDLLAERISAEAMILISQVGGSGHPDMAEMLHLRAAIFGRLGRKQEARESLARSLEIARGFQRHTVDLRELPVRP
jgi:hypothetical protein